MAGSTAPLRGSPRSATSWPRSTRRWRRCPAEQARARPALVRRGLVHRDRPGTGSATLSGRDIDGGASRSYAEAVAQASLTGRQYDPAQASAWTAYPNRQCATCPATGGRSGTTTPTASAPRSIMRSGAASRAWASGPSARRRAARSSGGRCAVGLQPQPDETPPAGSASIDPEIDPGATSTVATSSRAWPLCASSPRTRPTAAASCWRASASQARSPRTASSSRGAPTRPASASTSRSATQTTGGSPEAGPREHPRPVA